MHQNKATLQLLLVIKLLLVMKLHPKVSIVWLQEVKILLFLLKYSVELNSRLISNKILL